MKTYTIQPALCLWHALPSPNMDGRINILYQGYRVFNNVEAVDAVNLVNILNQTDHSSLVKLILGALNA